MPLWQPKTTQCDGHAVMSSMQRGIGCVAWHIFGTIQKGASAKDHLNGLDLVSAWVPPLALGTATGAGALCEGVPTSPELVSVWHDG